MSLATAPLECTGDWGESPADEAALVIARIRQVCLAGVELPSDRQPSRLKVNGRVAVGPHIWLDATEPDTATVVIDGSGRNWCRLSYQFGHELGHVVCNSWNVDSVPLYPTQWLEECLAEAFSLRGLALLADNWDADPVLAQDPDYGKHLRRYREFTIAPYRRGGPSSALHQWFGENRNGLENDIGGRPSTGPALLMILSELDRDPGCVADLGAINRWPSRAAAPIEDYLEAWRQSSVELGAPARLPVRIRDMLFFDEPAPNVYHRPPDLNLQYPDRGQAREEVVRVDELVASDHPVRIIWSLAERLDLSAYAGEPGQPARPLPAVLFCLWLWAAAEGIGSAHHIGRLCHRGHAYRWLSGGITITPETLIEFRQAPGIIELMARGLAALAEESIIPLELLSSAILKSRRLIGPSPATWRRRFRAQTSMARARLHELSAATEREDPISDEHLTRHISELTISRCQERAVAALGRMNS